ncbi:hypothetical protein [Vulgatibacter sp.]|uniref:hypothetical protein n=1 Tax=Vulgatibacter sp. TaxID=1971226 RepID=UPI0035635E3D
MGQFSDFLSEKGIETKRLLQVSQRLERVGNADRDLIRKRAEKRRRNPGQSYADANLGKPKSGRSLRPGHIEAAMQDKPVPGPVRSKMVRAVNRLLEKKGQDAVTAPKLFGAVPGKQGKKPR